MPLKVVSDESSKTGAKIYRNQVLIEASLNAVGGAEPPSGELEKVEQTEGADAVLYDNQVVLLATIRGVCSGQVPPETSLKRHALDGPGAVAGNQAIIYENIRALALPSGTRCSAAAHKPLQIKHGQTAYAYLTANQKELLALIRSKSPNTFVVVQAEKEAGCCCALM